MQSKTEAIPQEASVLFAALWRVRHDPGLPAVGVRASGEAQRPVRMRWMSCFTVGMKPFE
jgi:hypothetical protein